MRLPLARVVDGVGEDAGGEHLDQVGTVGRGGVDVLGGLELGERRARGVVERVGHVDDDGHVAHRHEADPRPDDLAAVGLDERGAPDQGVVAVAAGDLGERDAGTLGQGREERLHGDLVVGEGGLEGAGEQLRRRDRTTTAHRRDVHGSLQQPQHHRHLGRGVGVHERADGGAAVADRRVRHVGERHREQRLDLGRLGVGEHVGVPGEGADPDPGGVPVAVDA